jgi:hypothetical protein
MNPVHTLIPLIALIDTFQAELAVGLLLGVATLLGSMALATFFLVRMPADYLQSPENAPFWPDRPAWQRTAARVGKNLLGALFITLGIVLSIPGIPGQGILTILIGIMLLDIPGKRRIERRLIGRGHVLSIVNRLRARFGRAPLELGDLPAGPS